MANPQLEHGHLRLANELHEAVYAFDFGKRQARVLLAFLRLSYGYRRKFIAIDVDEMAVNLGIAKTHVRTAVHELVALNVLEKREGPSRRSFGVYRLVKDWETWKAVLTGRVVKAVPRNEKEVDRFIVSGNGHERTSVPTKTEPIQQEHSDCYSDTKSVPEEPNRCVEPARNQIGSFSNNADNGADCSGLRNQIGASGNQIGASGNQIGASGYQIGASGYQIGASGYQIGSHDPSTMPSAKGDARVCKDSTKSKELNTHSGGVGELRENAEDEPGDFFGLPPELFDGSHADDLASQVYRILQGLAEGWKPSERQRRAIVSVLAGHGTDQQKLDAFTKSLENGRGYRDWALAHNRSTGPSVDKAIEAAGAHLAKLREASSARKRSSSPCWSTPL